MSSNIDILDKLHPDLINGFLSTGRGDGIPKDVQLFLKQLQWAAEIYEYERNITRASKKLRQRINAQQHINIDERTCKARIYAAISYFSIDNNVSIKYWETDYADKFEDMAKLCAVNRNYKIMHKCLNDALECRRRAAQMAESDRDMGIVFLIDPRVKAEDMGYESQNLKKIASNNAKGYYTNLIDNLPINKEEHKRLLREADIEEAEYEELND